MIRALRLRSFAPMFLSSPPRLRPSLAFGLLAGFTLPLHAADPPPSTAAPSPAFASRPPASAVPDPDRQPGHTPAQFRPLDAARQPIDPADFRESLLSAAIFQATNQQRADLRLPAFLPDDKASTAARLHSAWMAGRHALSHDEPSDQGPPATVRDRLTRQGLHPHAAAENIAYNFLLDLAPGKPFYARTEKGRSVFSYQPGGPPLRAYTYEEFARAIVTQWMRSPPHRANLVDPTLRFLGVGAALAHRPDHPDTIYATQDFFTPHPPTSAMMTSGEATLLPTPAK